MGLRASAQTKEFHVELPEKEGSTSRKLSTWQMELAMLIPAFSQCVKDGIYIWTGTGFSAAQGTLLGWAWKMRLGAPPTELEADEQAGLWDDFACSLEDCDRPFILKAAALWEVGGAFHAVAMAECDFLSKKNYFDFCKRFGINLKVLAMKRDDVDAVRRSAPWAHHFADIAPSARRLMRMAEGPTAEALQLLVRHFSPTSPTDAHSKQLSPCNDQFLGLLSVLPGRTPWLHQEEPAYSSVFKTVEEGGVKWYHKVKVVVWQDSRKLFRLQVAVDGADMEREAEGAYMELEAQGAKVLKWHGDDRQAVPPKAVFERLPAVRGFVAEFVRGSSPAAGSTTGASSSGWGEASEAAALGQGAAAPAVQPPRVYMSYKHQRMDVEASDAVGNMLRISFKPGYPDHSGVDPHFALVHI